MDDLHELEFSRVTDVEMSILIFPKKMEGTDSTFDDDDVVHVLKLEDLREWEQLLRVYNELVVWVKRNGQKDFTSLDEASQQLRAIYESLLELLPSLKVKVGEGHALVKLIEDSIACYVRDLLSCPNVNHMGVARLDLECFSMAQMTHSILLPAPSDGDFIRHNKASLMRFFQAWLNDIDNKINVIEAVREAYDEYRSFFREMLNWQRPESDVAGLLLQFEQDKINGTELVLELTHRGGWETESSIRVSKSLNVLIIELLCKKCQQIYRERAGYSKADQLADSNLITKISPDSFKQVARVLREELNRLSTLTASVKV